MASKGKESDADVRRGNKSRSRERREKESKIASAAVSRSSSTEMLEASPNAGDAFMQRLLASIGPIVKDELADGIEAAEKRWEKKVDCKLAQFEEKQQKDYEDLDNKLKELNARFDNSETKQKEVKVQVLEVSKALEVAEKVASGAAAPRRLTIGNDGDKVDLSIVHVSAGGVQLDFTKTKELVASIAAEAGLLPQHFKLTPQTTSKRYTVQFEGLGDTASRRATKFLECQKTSDGTWVERTVAGTKVYIDPDRSKNERRKNYGLKQAINIFNDNLPCVEVYKFNREFKVKSKTSKHTLAVVEIEDGELSIKFSKKAEELGLDIATARDAFLAATTDQTEWV